MLVAQSKRRKRMRREKGCAALMQRNSTAPDFRSDVVGGEKRYAEYTATEGVADWPRVIFSYAIQAGDDTSRGLAVAPTIEQNGGAIRGRKGLYCALSLPNSLSPEVRVANDGHRRGGLPQIVSARLLWSELSGQALGQREG
jgi:hypothetical protein